MARNPCGFSSRSILRMVRPGALAIVVAGGLLGFLSPQASAAEFEAVPEPARQPEPVEAKRPVPRARGAARHSDARPNAAAARLGAPAAGDRPAGAARMVAPNPAAGNVIRMQDVVQQRVPVAVQQRGVVMDSVRGRPTGVISLFPPDTDPDDADQRGDDASIARLLSLPKRAWGPEQAVGEPDTPGAGYIETAWASQTPDGETEWLQVEYAQPVVAKQLLIHETCSPGALFKVSVFDPDGKEVTVWQGADPTPVGAGRGVSEIPIDVKFKVQRAKIHLDSTLVAGFNEIDAVGLKDDAGKIHWAKNAKSSSTYAPSVVTLPVMINANDLVRLRALDQEVKQLRKDVKKIHELEAELQELRKLLRGAAEKKPAP